MEKDRLTVYTKDGIETFTIDRAEDVRTFMDKLIKFYDVTHDKWIAINIKDIERIEIEKIQ